MSSTLACPCTLDKQPVFDPSWCLSFFCLFRYNRQCKMELTPLPLLSPHVILSLHPHNEKQSRRECDQAAPWPTALLPLLHARPPQSRVGPSVHLHCSRMASLGVTPTLAATISPPPRAAQDATQESVGAGARREREGALAWLIGHGGGTIMPGLGSGDVVWRWCTIIAAALRTTA